MSIRLSPARVTLQCRAWRPAAPTISIPIFNAEAQQICTQEELAAGIRTALERHANIINISASQQTDLLRSCLSDALQAAANSDALVTPPATRPKPG